MKEEWAQTCDDILWRRTKLGLFFSEAEKDKLQNWLK
jgi:glycerol-3-phosphate dehydrogenase